MPTSGAGGVESRPPQACGGTCGRCRRVFRLRVSRGRSSRTRGQRRQFCVRLYHSPGRPRLTSTLFHRELLLASETDSWDAGCRPPRRVPSNAGFGLERQLKMLDCSLCPFLSPLFGPRN